MNSEFLKMNEKGQKRKIHNGPTRTTMTRRRRPTQPNPKPVLDVCFSYCSYCTRKDALLLLPDLWPELPKKKVVQATPVPCAACMTLLLIEDGRVVTTQKKHHRR
jgi:hypothetical protein